MKTYVLNEKDIAEMIEQIFSELNKIEDISLIIKDLVNEYFVRIFNVDIETENVKTLLKFIDKLPNNKYLFSWLSRLYN